MYGWQCQKAHKLDYFMSHPYIFFQKGHPSKLCYMLTGNSIEQLRKKDVEVGLLIYIV